MNITRENHDDVSALLTLTLDKVDYRENVEKTLLKYSKTANVPGFRKGKVPLSFIRKQYEAGVVYEEINKQVSEGINKYITENKLRLLGQAIPQTMEEQNRKFSFALQSGDAFKDIIIEQKSE